MKKNYIHPQSNALKKIKKKLRFHLICLVNTGPRQNLQKKLNNLEIGVLVLLN